jgi:two-component system, NarL family, nitrate/nitrite response regulator NarL
MKVLDLPGIGNAIRVLLVDDHPCFLWALEQLVNNQHPQMVVVGATGKGTDALKLAAENQPDVIVLDIDLGTENGVDLLPHLLACSGARILALSDSRDAGRRDSAVLAGARGVVGKEERPETLLQAVRKVHAGELWLDRSATGRVFVELSRALQGGGKTDEQSRIASLTRREREVVGLVSSHPASSVKAIARVHHISEKTLRNHLTSIYDKLGLTSRLELHVFASTHKLDAVTPTPATPLRQIAQPTSANALLAA